MVSEVFINMNLHENIKRILREETSVKDFDYEKKNSDVHGIGLFATKNINKKRLNMTFYINDVGGI